MDHYYRRNEPVHQAFLEILLREESAIAGLSVQERKQIMEKFEKKAAPLHNCQWSEHIYNIISTQAQCPNDCRYCYMKTIKTRFFHAPPPGTCLSTPSQVPAPAPAATGDEADDIEESAASATVAPTAAPAATIALINQARVAKKWMRASEGAGARANPKKLIMFPSSHDIVPELLTEYIQVALKILNAGHDLMIVSKPRMDCMRPVADALDEFKARVIYRLTIGSDDQRILDFWEPHAPSFIERRSVLQMLHARGCLTSISMEPFLSDPIPIIVALAPFVSETIWVGTMSGLNEALAGSRGELVRLKDLHSLTSLIRIARALHAVPLGLKVRWKVKAMIAMAKVILQ